MIGLCVYLLAVNLAAFAAFGIDKRRAVRGGRRVRERTLLGLAAVGGTLGAVAGRAAFRHKTRKAGFSAWLTLIGLAQMGAALILYWPRPDG